MSFFAFEAEGPPLSLTFDVQPSVSELLAGCRSRTPFCRAAVTPRGTPAIRAWGMNGSMLIATSLALPFPQI